MDMTKMERVNRIIGHPLWQASAAQIEELETDRAYCGHTIDHFLHVARIAYIENLELELGINKELIYAAALLHDIGRGLEYTEGIRHETASAAMAPSIMEACGFAQGEIQDVVDAIKAHRSAEIAGEMNLTGVLYRADKKSRNCFRCSAVEGCNWSEEKKYVDWKGKLDENWK